APLILTTSFQTIMVAAGPRAAELYSAVVTAVTPAVTAGYEPIVEVGCVMGNAVLFDDGCTQTDSLYIDHITNVKVCVADSVATAEMEFVPSASGTYTRTHGLSVQLLLRRPAAESWEVLVQDTVRPSDFTVNEVNVFGPVEFGLFEPGQHYVRATLVDRASMNDAVEGTCAVPGVARNASSSAAVVQDRHFDNVDVAFEPNSPEGASPVEFVGALAAAIACSISAAVVAGALGADSCPLCSRCRRRAVEADAEAPGGGRREAPQGPGAAAEAARCLRPVQAVRALLLFLVSLLLLGCALLLLFRRRGGPAGGVGEGGEAGGSPRARQVQEVRPGPGPFVITNMWLQEFGSRASGDPRIEQLRTEVRAKTQCAGFVLQVGCQAQSCEEPRGMLRASGALLPRGARVRPAVLPGGSSPSAALAGRAEARGLHEGSARGAFLPAIPSFASGLELGNAAGSAAIVASFLHHLAFLSPAVRGDPAVKCPAMAEIAMKKMLQELMEFYAKYGLRKLLNSFFLAAHFEQLKARSPKELGDDNAVEVQFHGISQVYKLKFKTEDSATEFQRKANMVGISCRDFRDQSVHPLRIRGDLPLHVRQKKRAFSSIYVSVKQLAMKSPPSDASCKLGVNGRKGALQVISDSDVYELVSAKQGSGDQFTFEPNQASLTTWGITPDQIQEALDDL
ncbi:unnamed protein product, partial [Prorocentrum cordatum]